MKYTQTGLCTNTEDIKYRNLFTIEYANVYDIVYINHV